MLAEITMMDLIFVEMLPALICLVVGIILYILCASKDFEIGKFIVLFLTIAAVSYFIGAKVFDKSPRIKLYMAIGIPLLYLLFIYIPSKVRRKKRKKEKEQREALKEEQKRLKEERKMAPKTIEADALEAIENKKE